MSELSDVGLARKVVGTAIREKLERRLAGFDVPVAAVAEEVLHTVCRPSLAAALGAIAAAGGHVCDPET